MAALTAYAAELRAQGAREVPDFDPLDGGVHASALFLLEKPGPKTSVARGGSGFVSRNNNDGTAEATWHFMRQARLPRERTVIWNVVPWWNGTVSLTGQELASGAACVTQLLSLLAKLRVVVLVGRHAATRARPYLEAAPVALLTSAHPSPQVRAARRDLWDAIPLQWAEARRYM